MNNKLNYQKTSVLDIAYESWGTPAESATLLLHGFPDDARSWTPVAEAFAKAGHYVVAPYFRGFGPTRFLNKETPRTGQLAALTNDILELVDGLGVKTFTLVGHDWGARTAQAIAALYPERVKYLVSFTDYEIAWSNQGFPPYPALHALWYQWLLLLDFGPAVLHSDRRGFCQYLWKVWSPTWKFEESVFDETAKSFDTPDFVEVVLSGYRHGRHPEAVSDARYSELETELATAPKITVPTTLLIGADDGILQPWPGDERWRSHFIGETKRQLLAGVGHFPHRENPKAVIKAILES